jgi:DNA-binding GntR family transcriptional regulator
MSLPDFDRLPGFSVGDRAGPPARPRSAVDEAADTIRDFISTGRFVAGQRLPEADLVEQLGVSKTVLREAFAKLQQDGIIELQMYKGAMIRRLSLDEVLQILSVSTVMIALGMQEAAAAISSRPDRRASFLEARSKLQTLDPRDQREHLRIFYDVIDVILDLAGNPYLTDMFQKSNNPLIKEFLLDSVVFKKEVVAHTRKLDEVLELVERGDGPAAFNALRAWTRIDRSWVNPTQIAVPPAPRSARRRQAPRALTPRA